MTLTDPSTWFNTPEEVMAITSVITLFLLVGALIFTYVQIRIARTARREQERPFVIIDVFTSRASVFRLEIKNIGRTIARNVRFEFDPELESTDDKGDRRVRNVPILARGAPTPAPGKRHTLLLDSRKRLSAGLPDTYAATVTYSGPDGHRYTDKQIVDIGIHWNTSDLIERDIHDVAKTLLEMKTTVENINAAILSVSDQIGGESRLRGVWRPGAIQQSPPGGPMPTDQEAAEGAADWDTDGD